MAIKKPEGLTIPRGEPGADLLALLEPYLWVSEVLPVYAGHYRGALLYVGIYGAVRWEPETPPDLPAHQAAADVLAHTVRSSLFNRAETAVAAVEEPGGYQHARHPQIEITGRRVDAPAGGDEPYLLVAEATLRMWLTR